MTNEPILSLSNISKAFPGVKALNHVSIDFYKGEVHAIVGENGAGKSTLMKIISGVYIPDSGVITLDNEEAAFKRPREALEKGISIIHQELNIAKDLTVAENIYLGEEIRMKGFMPFLDRKLMERLSENILEKMGVRIDVRRVSDELTASEQQIIEIAKVINRKSKIIIMDEPTSSLSEAEIKVLFKIIQQLKQEGITIIYISHRMKEIFEICDRVTILRDGCLIRTSNIRDTNEKEVVANMIGRTITSYYDKTLHLRKKEMLRVDDLTIYGVFENISFTLYEGEILGISGLVGSKRTDVLECIFGVKKPDKGKIFIRGKEVTLNNPREANDYKIGLVTEDRRRTGLMLDQSVLANLVLPSLSHHKNKAGIVDSKWETEVTKEYINKISIKTPGVSSIIRNLSGGNQQKVILSRWLAANSEILLLDEPTRGIDVNAKAEFYKIMNAFVSNGGGILMVSSEMPEILGVADRILVMREGRIRGELDGSSATELKIIELASFD